MHLHSAMVLAIEVLESVDLDEVEQGMGVDVEEVDEAIETFREALAEGWPGWRP